MPLYARAGSIIPFGPLREYTSQKVDGPLVLNIYPGADAAFTLYEDDGTTFDYRRGEWMKVLMAWNERRRVLTLRLAKGSRMLPPSKREIEVRIVPEKTTRKVTFEGRPVEVKF
jgi:alpha-glucosidase (family GH31 glycosyl hydrolase)